MKKTKKANAQSLEQEDEIRREATENDGWEKVER